MKIDCMSDKFIVHIKAERVNNFGIKIQKYIANLKNGPMTETSKLTRGAYLFLNFRMSSSWKYKKEKNYIERSTCKKMIWFSLFGVAEWNFNISQVYCDSQNGGFNFKLKWDKVR